MDCALGGDRHNKLMASTGQAKRRVSKELENRSATQIFKKGWWWTQDFCFQISFFMNSHRNSPPGHPWSMRKVAIAQAQRGQLSGLGWEMAMAEIKSRRSEESMIVNEIGLWLFMTRHCRMAVHFFCTQNLEFETCVFICGAGACRLQTFGEQLAVFCHSIFPLSQVNGERKHVSQHPAGLFPPWLFLVETLF